MKGVNVVALLSMLSALLLQQTMAVSLSFSCPNCDLDQQTSYGCEGAVSSNRKLCLVCPPGLVSCRNSARNNFLSTCRSLTDNPFDCGACGNECKGETPDCVGSTCTCSPSSLSCGQNGFCNVGAGKCQTCPTGKVNLATSGDTGVEGDCEVDLNSDTNNCGDPLRRCGAGETCNGGKCVCGSNPFCTFPKEICSDGQCVACLSATSDTVCHKNNVFDDSSFCNPASKQCETCPLGFADCSNTKLPSGTDNGTAADCETNIAPTGVSSNCGACDAPCGVGHSAQTCCAGTCKCGKFASTSTPTDGECAAAVQCTSKEYCDEALAVCLPLDPGNEVCNRNAQTPTENSGGFNQKATCGSCNRTEALANIVNNTCQASNTQQCGATGELCRAGQTCIKGRCHCSFFNFFSFNEFTDRDLDGDNKLNTQGRPAFGCNFNTQVQVRDGFFARVENTVFRLIDCIQLTNPSGVDRITPSDIADPGFIASVCPGGAGKCPTAFCNELVNNLTNVERGPFCDAVERTSADLKRCATDFRLNANDGSGDLTCANLVAFNEITSLRSSFTYLDAFNFLGCREPKLNTTIVFAGDTPLTQINRVETGILLLGSAISFGPSMLITALAGVVMVVAAWM